MLSLLGSSITYLLSWYNATLLPGSNLLIKQGGPKLRSEVFDKTMMMVQPVDGALAGLCSELVTVVPVR
jgi:hypothetical protein